MKRRLKLSKFSYANFHFGWNPYKIHVMLLTTATFSYLLERHSAHLTFYCVYNFFPECHGFPAVFKANPPSLLRETKPFLESKKRSVRRRWWDDHLQGVSRHVSAGDICIRRSLPNHNSGLAFACRVRLRLIRRLVIASAPQPLLASSDAANNRRARWTFHLFWSKESGAFWSLAARQIIISIRERESSRLPQDPESIYQRAMSAWYRPRVFFFALQRRRRAHWLKRRFNLCPRPRVRIPLCATSQIAFAPRFIKEALLSDLHCTRIRYLLAESVMEEFWTKLRKKWNLSLRWKI
jgi:hypothetical protein